VARVTVEDCIEQVPNRFQLVLLAAHRARAIQTGEHPLISRDNDKDPVVALREIADKALSLEGIRDSLVAQFQDMRPAVKAEEESDRRALLIAPTATEDDVMKALQAEQEAQRDERPY
jgi:DNA-directed RNA polymerase subunit omega